MERRVAWLLVAVSAACLVLDTVFTAAQMSLLSELSWVQHAWPLIPLTTLGCSLRGALIVTRRPGHLIGRLLLVTGLTSFAGPTESYSLWVLDGSGPGPASAGHVVAWISMAFNAPLGLTGLVLIFLTAPEGALRSRRWRHVGRAAVLGLLLWLAAVASLSPTTSSVNDENGGPAFHLLASAGLLLLTGSLVAAAVNLVLRVQEATGDTRRQLLWITASAVLIAGAVATSLVLDLGGFEWPWFRPLLFASYLTMPIFIAVAVLRHRLFDIDVIVSRALVVTLATALVGTAYVLIVVSLGPLLTGGAGTLSLFASAVVAVAFQPLRRRVVRVADRLAYGAAAIPYDALADFSRRLGNSPDPATLLPAVAEAAARAARAHRATARYGELQSSTWPAGEQPRGGATVGLPVVDAGEQLGSIVVEMPPGSRLRGDELALLRDLADSAAVAFRATRLSDELVERVDDLDRQAHDLEASRRRLITAGDVERCRLERSIARDVIPHLSPMPARLAVLAASDAEPALVEPLIEQATAALDALRDITRGVYPAQLVRSGLEPALRSLVGRDGGGRLVVAQPLRKLRFAAPVEAAAYFCVAEAVRDLHPPVQVALSCDADRLQIQVSGAGQGELPLAAMRDRVEALGGTVTLSVSAGRARMAVSVPTGAEALAQPAGSLPAQAAASVAGPSADLVR